MRDQLKVLEAVTSEQKVVSDAGVEQDVIALARDNGRACVQIFYVRDGLLIGRDHFMLDLGIDDDDTSLISAFLKQYSQAAYVPKEILVSGDFDQRESIEAWLRKNAEPKSCCISLSGARRDSWSRWLRRMLPKHCVLPSRKTSTGNSCSKGNC